MSRSGMFGPAVCSLAVVCRVLSSAMQRSAHDSGCRLARGLVASMSLHMYRRLQSLARRSSGTMAQLSARIVVRPVVRLVVARPVFHQESPAAPGP